MLDEATSNVDAESEHLIRDALARLMEGRTTLVTAHRLSAVLTADRVAVVDDGRIVDEGPPDEVLQKDRRSVRLLTTTGPEGEA